MSSKATLSLWTTCPSGRSKIILQNYAIRSIISSSSLKPSPSFCLYRSSHSGGFGYRASASVHNSAIDGSNRSNKKDSEPDYTTNDGLVVGVWVFCRHGDRTPSRSLGPTEFQQEESSFWISKLPTPNTIAAYESLSQLYTPNIHPSNNNGRFLDVGRNPFGFLTQLGMLQMKENGNRFYKRYNSQGYRRRRIRYSLMEPDAIQRENHDYERKTIGNDFLHDWDVKVYSTNYLRTVLSVQSFLDGLLGTNCYDPIKAEREEFSQGSWEEQKVPDHSYLKDNHIPTESVIPINVNDQTKDELNAFDRNPDLMSQLVSEVMTTNYFQQYDSQAAPLAARMANILPGLARKGRKDFSRKTPSGINWVETADHFVCRTAHNVCLTDFTYYEDQTDQEQTLKAMSYQALTHLSWRFRQWYKNKKLLASITFPPLRTISEALQTTAQMGDNDVRHPFVLYSCHDVTLLALLYALGAEFLADDDAAQWRYWPNYASTIAVELVQIQDSNTIDTKPDHPRHVVRVLLNGEPIRSVDLLSQDCSDGAKWDGTAPPIGNGPSDMLLIEDFANIVRNLEQQGDYDHAQWR